MTDVLSGRSWPRTPLAAARRSSFAALRGSHQPGALPPSHRAHSRSGRGRGRPRAAPGQRLRSPDVGVAAGLVAAEPAAEARASRHHPQRRACPARRRLRTPVEGGRLRGGRGGSLRDRGAHAGRTGSDLSLVDLVPCVDRAMADGVSAAEVRAAMGSRTRGAVTLRRALSLADPRSESWWESVLRLQHVVTGLGPVDCQAEIWTDGTFVARADLHLVGTTRYPECDGGEHQDPAPAPPGPRVPGVSPASVGALRLHHGRDRPLPADDHP